MTSGANPGVICGAALDTPYHVGIAAVDIDATMAALGSALGLHWVALTRPPVLHDTPSGPIAPSSRVVYSREGPLHVELIQAEPGTVYPVDRGTHLHHVGYWVDDLRRSIGDAERDGWTLEATMFDDDRRPTAFAYLSLPGRPWLELVDARNRDALYDLLGGAGDGADLWHLVDGATGGPVDA